METFEYLNLCSHILSHKQRVWHNPTSMQSQANNILLIYLCLEGALSLSLSLGCRSRPYMHGIDLIVYGNGYYICHTIWSIWWILAWCALFRFCIGKSRGTNKILNLINNWNASHISHHFKQLHLIYDSLYYLS